jgi:hypothetical protein
MDMADLKRDTVTSGHPYRVVSRHVTAECPGQSHSEVTSRHNVTDTVPLATFRKVKGQLREERRLRAQAEAERDQLKATLGDVLQGLRHAGREE